jgi:propanol-preferring alcohol dehydrogenase
MKACVLETPSPIEDRPLKYMDVDLPIPEGNEVRVRVTACGVCRTDLHVAEGDLPQRIPAVIPGHQIIGVIETVGESVSEFSLGQGVGVAWLHATCGTCRFCSSGRENLCEKAEFTGWTCDGGFAEYVLADSRYVYPIPDGFADVQAAPLLCAGIIGYRALKLTGITS